MGKRRALSWKVEKVGVKVAKDPLLVVENLHVHFETSAGVAKPVRGVSFQVGLGDTLGIVGESGSGKSVTAQAIMRLIQSPGRIVDGSIQFRDTDLVETSEKVMQTIRGNSISMIFQEPMTALNPVIKVGEQIAEVVRLHRGLAPQQAWAYAIEMLRKVGINDPETRANGYPHQLSGGMRQRVMIAAALSCDPQLIIADEPTTALDVTIQAQILDLMREVQVELGVSMILITHDLGVVAETAQRVVVMYAGQVVEVSETTELFAKPLHPYTVGLMNSAPSLDEDPPEDRMLTAIGGVVPSVIGLSETACAFHDRCPRAHDKCRESQPELVKLEGDHQVRCWLYE